MTKKKLKYEKKEGVTTISNIAKELEEELLDENGETTVTSRTIERMFPKALEILDIEKEKAKTNGNYEVDSDMKLMMKEHLREAVRKGSMVKKILTGKEDELTTDDYLEHFENISKNTEGKMDEDLRQIMLRDQDEVGGYSKIALMKNIQEILMAIIRNLEVYPYEYQIQILKEIEEIVFKRYLEELKKEAECVIKDVVHLYKLENNIEIDSEEDYSCLEEISKFYEDRNNRIKKYLDNNPETKQKLEKELGLKIEDYIK